MRDTTFGEKLPTTTLTTRGLIPTTTSGTMSQQWDTTTVGHHNKWDNSGTTEEPVFQHIGYKLLRTTTPTEQTGDPDVSQHITYRDGSNHRHYWGLLQKKVRFKTYLPVGTFPRGWYI